MGFALNNDSISGAADLALKEAARLSLGSIRIIGCSDGQVPLDDSGPHVARSTVKDYDVETLRDKSIDASSIGTGLGQAKSRDMFNAAIAAAVGALKSRVETIHDANGVLTRGYIDNILHCEDRISSFVMEGSPFHGLLQGAKLVQKSTYYGACSVFEGSIDFGLRTVAVADHWALEENLDGETSFLTLGLVFDAVEVEERVPGFCMLNPIVGDTDTAPANIRFRFQAEWEYVVRVRGMKWIGPKKADVIDLANPDNWELLTPVSSGPGILIRSN